MNVKQYNFIIAACIFFIVTDLPSITSLVIYNNWEYLLFFFLENQVKAPPLERTCGDFTLYITIFL